jgi:hypothetical protein
VLEAFPYWIRLPRGGFDLQNVGELQDLSGLFLPIMRLVAAIALGFKLLLE